METKIWKLYTGLIRIIERIKAILRYFHWIIFKQMEIILKMQNTMFATNYYMSSYNYYMTVIYNEGPPRKV